MTLDGARVGVVGGGVAGLAAAVELGRLGAETYLYESSDTVGGQIRTFRAPGFVIEDGADGFSTPSSSERELLTTLGLTGRLVKQRALPLLSYRAGTLSRLNPKLAAELLGIRTHGVRPRSSLLSFETGMSDLVDALESALSNATIRRAKPVLVVSPSPDGIITQTQNHNYDAVDLLVIATPPVVAGKLLSFAAQGLGDTIPVPELTSIVTVSLAFPRSAVVHPLDATGFVVIGRDGAVPRDGLRACSFASSKFPGRAPRDHVLVRAFYRPGDALGLDEADERWVDRAIHDLDPVLGLRADCILSRVARWPQALPARPGAPAGTSTLDLIHRCGERVVVAGSAVTGPGVLSALCSGRKAASAVHAASHDL